MENFTTITYNEDHVLFLSHHSGTTLVEAFLSVILPQTIFLYKQLLLFWPKLTLINIYLRFAVEFVLIVVPQLFVFTIANEYAVQIALNLLAICLIIVVTQMFVLYRSKKSTQLAVKQRFDLNRNFITEGRSLVFVGTAICILAVDFQIFPRRFAKTEKYGFGVMDLGIGFFIVLHGYASSDGRGVRRDTKERFKRLFYANAPLVLLGFLRLMSVKLSGYHEHISEYGLHWNFFFTLAFIKVLAGLLFIKFNPRFSFLLGLLLILFYQSLLNFSNYTGYIMEDSLKSYKGILYYIHVNRSGLFSTVGNVALYLFAVQMGLNYHMTKRNTIRQWILYITSIYILFALMLALLFVCNNYVQLISRRLANVTYVIFVMTYVSLFVATALLCDLVCSVRLQSIEPQLALLKKRSQSNSGTKISLGCSYYLNFTSVLLNSVDRNGLVHFLFANIATGAVNLYIKTIYTSNVFSMVILLLYTLLTCLIPFIIELKRFEIKQKIDKRR